MAFNGDTYRSRKAAKEAWEALELARQKRLENDTIGVLTWVKVARARMRLSVFYLKEAQEGLK